MFSSLPDLNLETFHELRIKKRSAGLQHGLRPEVSPHEIIVLTLPDHKFAGVRFVTNGDIQKINSILKFGNIDFSFNWSWRLNTIVGSIHILSKGISYSI